MLVSITNRCNEGCSHCLARAVPDGAHMSNEDWSATLALLNSVQPTIIQISGGEPTLHPQFFMWTYMLRKVFPSSFIMIQSNGSFAEDEDLYDQMQALLEPRIHLQIRTHPKFYPNYVRTWNSNKLRALPHTGIFNDHILITPLGRATGWETTRQHASCANVYLMLAQLAEIEDLHDLMATLNKQNKFCAPMISHDGKIRVGESIDCQAVGSVRDTSETIVANIRKSRLCNKCNLQQNFEYFLWSRGLTPEDFWAKVRG